MILESSIPEVAGDHWRQASTSTSQVTQVRYKLQTKYNYLGGSGWEERTGK